MNISKVLLLLAFLCVSSTASADTASEKEAEKLLSLVGMEKALEQSMSQMLDLQIQQNPALAPYKEVMLEFIRKYMSYESLKPDMLKMYSEAFTADELKQINSFYATDVGKKTIEKMPTLMAQGSQIGAARVQENIGELQAMIKAESERIQNLESQ
ncbi:MAG: DUF2059 domain-containing protein [Pseudomonadota bacterium]